MSWLHNLLIRKNGGQNLHQFYIRQQCIVLSPLEHVQLPVKEILHLGKGYFFIEVDSLHFTVQSKLPTTISFSSLRPTVVKGPGAQQYTGHRHLCLSMCTEDSKKVKIYVSRDQTAKHLQCLEYTFYRQWKNPSPKENFKGPTYSFLPNKHRNLFLQPKFMAE